MQESVGNGKRARPDGSVYTPGIVIFVSKAADDTYTVGARTVLDKPTLEAFEEASADERYKGKDARVIYKWLNESERL